MNASETKTPDGKAPEATAPVQMSAKVKKEKKKPREIQIWGTTVVLKVDLIAAIGAVFGVFSFGWQLISYYYGRPHIDLFSPDYVYVYFLPTVTGESVVRFAGPLTATNTGKRAVTNT
jgi:hypothetical protein